MRLDTSNPPGNETRVADYLKQVADGFGIQAERLGADPKRLNFVARLKGTGKGRPLLLLAHSDVAPVSPADGKWTAEPFQRRAQERVHLRTRHAECEIPTGGGVGRHGGDQAAQTQAEPRRDSGVGSR